MTAFGLFIIKKLVCYHEADLHLFIDQFFFPCLLPLFNPGVSPFFRSEWTVQFVLEPENWRSEPKESLLPSTASYIPVTIVHLKAWCQAHQRLMWKQSWVRYLHAANCQSHIKALMFAWQRRRLKETKWIAVSYSLLPKCYQQRFQAVVAKEQRGKGGDHWSSWLHLQQTYHLQAAGPFSVQDQLNSLFYRTWEVWILQESCQQPHNLTWNAWHPLRPLMVSCWVQLLLTGFSTPWMQMATDWSHVFAGEFLSRGTSTKTTLELEPSQGVKSSGKMVSFKVIFQFWSSLLHVLHM